MVVEFFPLEAEDLEIPPPFGTVSFDKTMVLEGVVSDKSCRSNPCEHSGTCFVTWNDFRYRLIPNKQKHLILCPGYDWFHC
jgi:protein crumbs